MSTAEAQTSAEAARRRPLVQYEIRRRKRVLPATPEFEATTVEELEIFRSAGGSKPSHQLVEPAVLVASAPTLEVARLAVPEGYRHLARRKDDRVDLVEVWV